MGDLNHDTKLDIIVTTSVGWQVLLNTCPWALPARLPVGISARAGVAMRTSAMGAVHANMMVAIRVREVY